jgi:2',3'-cyclic-nucleotide 2'-phosphodiesterase (5'-nucleotidase family)
MSNKFGTMALILALLLPMRAALAVDIQILHTNDLHGFFEHSISNPEVGGYARIKAMMNDLRSEGQSRGIETLAVDAGDFMEGNLYYMANKGRDSFQIMNLMGYDAVAMGNHDYLMGSGTLEDIVKNHPPQFAFLGANFQVINILAYPHLAKEVAPYKIYEFDGIKVAFIGLTTNELFYTWSFNGGKISSPVKAGNKLAKKLKREGKADFVVALTHLGVIRDLDLVEEGEDIDFVVGGHSHTALKEPIFHENKRKRKIGIVQAGHHGEYLGRSVIRVEKNKALELVEYALLPVDASKEKDSVVEEFVAQAKAKIDVFYNEGWLDTVVGKTEVPLESATTHLTPWIVLQTEALAEAVGADVAFHSPGFAGTDLPVGDITRRDLFNAHPRVFDLNDSGGWHVYSVDIYGVVLKSIIRLAIRGQQALSFTGITFDLLDSEQEELDVDVDWIGVDDEVPVGTLASLTGRYLGIDGKFRISNIRIKGEAIQPFKRYRLALNEGIVVGGLGISKVVKYLLRKMSRSDKTVWQALIDKVKRIGTITNDTVSRDVGESEPLHFSDAHKSLLVDYKKGAGLITPGPWRVP